MASLPAKGLPSLFSLKPSASQGDHPSKFQLLKLSRFGGVREQTNTLTDILLLYTKEGV